VVSPVASFIPTELIDLTEKKVKDLTDQNVQVPVEKKELKLLLNDIKKKDSVFVIEDPVDGQCSLGNGAQRWYPGKISQANIDGTYTILYLDGDIHENKARNEIRHSKSISLSTARSTARRTSGRDSVTNEYTARNSGDGTTLNLTLGGTARLSKDSARDSSKYFDSSLGDSLDRSLDLSRSNSTSIDPTDFFNEHSSPFVNTYGKTKGSEDYTSKSVFKPETQFLSTLTESSIAAERAPYMRISSARLLLLKGKQLLLTQNSNEPSFRSDASGCSGESTESDSFTYTISSVFKVARQERNVVSLVPKMHFANLDLSSSAAEGTGMSLSAALCRENTRDTPDSNFDEEDEDDDDEYDDNNDTNYFSHSNTHSPTALIHHTNPLYAVQSPRKNNKVIPLNTDSSAIDPNDHLVPTGIGAIKTPPTRRLGILEDNPNTRHSQSHKTLTLGLLANNAEDITCEKLLRTYHIISALLLQHCIIGEGNFLDKNKCTTLKAENVPSSGRGSISPCRGSESMPFASHRGSEGKNKGNDIKGNDIKGNDKGNNIKGLSDALSPSSNNVGNSVNSVLPAPPNIEHSNGFLEIKDINMLFTVREFLESVPDSEQQNVMPYLTEISNFSLGASMRVLKLISSHVLSPLLSSCLPGHMRGEKQYDVREKGLGFG
jgi:hypothetical protein